MTSFNPVYRIGAQIVEAIRAHDGETSKAEARERAIELLDSVGIPDAAQRVDDYPHEFSGGMRQRAMIAMALALEPEILIADEPTTALDVTVQAQILALLERLNRERGLATILITHDLGVVAEVADRVLVMYDGGRRARRARRDLLLARRSLHAQAARRRGPARRGAAAAAAGARASRCSRSPTWSSTSRSSAGCFDREVDQVRAVDGVSLSVRTGRNARPGRRVGQRQVDALAHDPAAAGADLGLGPLRGPRDRRALAAARCGRCGGRCRWSSRTPTPRSTRASGSARSSASRCACRARRAAPSCAGRSRSCSSGSASPPSTTTASRTSSPAASGSGSGSPGRWRCGRS